MYDHLYNRVAGKIRYIKRLDEAGVEDSRHVSHGASVKYISSSFNDSEEESLTPKSSEPEQD